MSCRFAAPALLFAFSSLASAQAPAHEHALPRPWQIVNFPTANQVKANWATPPSEYGPEPYYGLNGPVTIETVRHDLDTMLALGFRAVTVQYGYGSDRPYLSPAYLSFFREFVLAAKQRNMRVWIVDDAGYPSGFAGGKFSSDHPELRMQALTAKSTHVSGGDHFAQPVGPNTVAVTALNSASDTTVQIPFHDGTADWTAPAGEWTVYVVEHVFRTSPTRSDTNPKRTKDGSQSLEDYLDPSATRQYLAFTHQAYKRAVGDEFGKTILGFRGDEPDYSISGLPWTPKFFAQFQTTKGYDIRPYLASFLQPKAVALTPREIRARADYYDVFANLFRDGFFKPQGLWCAANGLEYEVHLNHEEAELQLAHSEGDFFRDMRYVEVPGIDAIWHQIWTDTISDYPRLASSAAHVYGHPRSFTESFAAYRPAPDVTMARYILNEEMVRGVNLVETMYFPASSTPGGGHLEAFMRDSAYPALMHYVSRMSYVMAMGKPAASVALLFPTASLWMGDTAADNTFVSTVRLLSEHQIDFDIVDEDAIADVLKPGPGTLETRSGNRLRTFIVPHVSALRESTVARLKALVQGGGHVLFLGDTPSQIAGRTFLDDRAATASDFNWAAVTKAELSVTPTPPAQPPASAPAPQDAPQQIVEALHKAVPHSELTLAKPDLALRYTHRTWNGAHVFLLFNESAGPIHNQLTLHVPAASVERWNPEKATIEPAAGATIGKGEVSLPLDLEPYATTLLVVKLPTH